MQFSGEARSKEGKGLSPVLAAVGIRDPEKVYFKVLRDTIRGLCPQIPPIINFNLLFPCPRNSAVFRIRLGGSKNPTKVIVLG